MHDGPPWGVFVGFAWVLLFLGFVFMRGLLRHRARMKALEVTRQLLEKGVQPPPELIEALKPRERYGAPRTPWTDLRSGVVLLAVAAALILFGLVLQFDGRGPAEHLHPLIGIAAFPGMIGLALIGLWWNNPERRGD